jgi:NADPH-dependent ferric siderophore reductase
VSEQVRTRREPPPFRRAALRHVEDLTPRLRRVVLGGPDLAGMPTPEPAASVRLLLPPSGRRKIIWPTWTGNQFELPSGERAPIRTFTPRSLDGDSLTLDLVLHERGATIDWIHAARLGDEVAVSGPGRGYDIDPEAGSFLLAGDESALPAVGQLLEALPTDVTVTVHVEIAERSAQLDLPAHPGATIVWHEADAGASPGDRFVTAIEAIEDLPDRIWVAGEAAAVQRVRKHLFDGRGIARSAATIRGYWKVGRAET